MDDTISLSNHFLIAMPNLGDPRFAESVTFICEHNAAGALGIVINRPLDVKLHDMFNQLGLEDDQQRFNRVPVYLGGPVHPQRGFVLHDGHASEWDASLQIDDNLCLTSSRDVLSAIADHNGPEKYLIALGYAGWSSGQLENELAANAWLSVPANRNVFFDLPSADRWHAAAAILGVDLRFMATQAGHA